MRTLFFSRQVEQIVTERTWGKGFAKLERIKKPAAAAHYMAKAANYISKGANGEQGPIRGNRYNIVQDAHPP